MIVLGIETSCDETAVALVDDKKNIIGNRVYSQIKKHQAFGGVVPEVAARDHLHILPQLTHSLLQKEQINPTELSAVASTIGPGLYGSLLVGTNFAQSLALGAKLPFVGINHLEAHVLTPRLTNNAQCPFLALLVSGGNTAFVIVKNPVTYQVIGTTIDDAIGEAYDKTARLLGYPYPGGKHIEKLAQTGNPKTHIFRPPLLQAPNCDFSFSGLKTAVHHAVTQVKTSNHSQDLTQQQKCDIATSFQASVLKVLRAKTERAIQRFIQNFGKFTQLVVCGGVAANMPIRNLLCELAARYEGEMLAPPLEYCGDNAAMVAWAAIEKLRYKTPLRTTLEGVKPNLRIGTQM